MTLFLIIIIITITIIITIIFSLNSLSHPSSGHGFRAYPVLGTLGDFIVNRHRFLEWTTEVLAGHPTHTSVFFRPGKVHGIMTAFPDNVEYVLKTNFPNYPKGPRFSSMLADFLGHGIFNADDELWRRQRKTASFAFSHRSLTTFVLDAVRTEISDRLIPLLRDASHSGRILDLQDVLERFAFDNVCKLAFDVDPGCLAGDGLGESEFMRAFEEAATLSSGRFMYVMPFLWKVKKLFNLGSEKRLRESINVVHNFANKIIRLRLEDSAKDYQDLLSRFISPTSGANDCDFLRGVVVSIILAGRDTTSSGLSWFFWLLSLRPDVVSKIRAEVTQVRERAGKRVGDAYDFNELREMHYLQGALSESLRLYPPVPQDTRVCLEDDILPDGTEIKKDWFITYNTYATGRMESIWGKDYLEFRPDRWLDQDGVYKPYSPFKYPVFHAGPRICLGKEMAYMQMKSIVACVLEEFDLDVLGKQTHPEFLLSITLRIKGGLHVQVKSRN